MEITRGCELGLERRFTAADHGLAVENAPLAGSRPPGEQGNGLQESPGIEIEKG